jgi:hypothetical protein
MDDFIMDQGSRILVPRSVLPPAWHPFETTGLPYRSRIQT